ncbi:MAG TPA: hypothetical protein VLE99_02465 [Candidatus Saccharimonadales bacterium]|nr:hypothetical protein [Candidatus Saccharimonadales bacterium]
MTEELESSELPTRVEALASTEVLRGATRVVDTSRGLYPPGEVGLPSGMEDQKLSIVLESGMEIAMDGGLYGEARVAVMKIEVPTKDGQNVRVGYALKGLMYQGSNVIASGGAIMIPPGEQGLVLGRGYGVGSAGPEPVVTADALWPGAQFGKGTSRSHVRYTVDAMCQLHVTDLSTNGTPVAAAGYLEGDMIMTQPRQRALPAAEEAATLAEVSDEVAEAEAAEATPASPVEVVAVEEPLAVGPPAPAAVVEEPVHAAEVSEPVLSDVAASEPGAAEPGADLLDDSTELVPEAVEATAETVNGEAVIADGMPGPATSALGAEERLEPAGNTATGVEEVPLTRQQALEELYDKWNLPRDTDPAITIARLGESLEALQKLQALARHDGELAHALGDVQRKIADTFNGSGLVYIMGHDIQQAQGQIDGLLTAWNTYRERLLPRAMAAEADALSQMLLVTRNSLDGVVPQNNLMDPGAAGDAQQMLYRSTVEDMFKAVTAMRAEVEQKQIEMLGYAAATELQNKEQGDQFANEQVRILAAELQKGDLSEADVERAVTAMERYVDNAVGDRGSGLQFPSRVVQNLANKLKERRPASGRNAEAHSRRVVAEMAVDMLRGTFNIENAKREPIEIDTNGRVVGDGEHRAAALMTLYGKNWVKVAGAAGYSIITK